MLSKILPRKIRRLFWSSRVIEVIYQGWSKGQKTLVISFKNGNKRAFVKKHRYWFLANTNRKTSNFEYRGIKRALSVLENHGKKAGTNGVIYVKK